MGDDQAIKLVITLHTHSEKLQSSIIKKDMDFPKPVSTPWSLELAKAEVDFLKNNTHYSSDTHTIERIPYPTIENSTTIHEEERTLWNKQGRKTIKICSYCGEKVPHTGHCKSCNAIYNLCSKKGHFGNVFESIDPPVKETNRVSHENITKDRNECPNHQDQWTTTHHESRLRRRSQHHFRKDMSRAPFQTSPATKWSKIQIS